MNLPPFQLDGNLHTAVGDQLEPSSYNPAILLFLTSSSLTIPLKKEAMAAPNISFADELKPVKSHGTHDDAIGVGGVFNLRSRRASKSSLRDSALPQEDEDPGLRNESDYKRMQVSDSLHPHPLAQGIIQMKGVLETGAVAPGVPVNWCYLR